MASQFYPPPDMGEHSALAPLIRSKFMTLYKSALNYTLFHFNKQWV